MAQIDLEEVLLALRAVLLSVSGLPTDIVYDDAYVVVNGQKQPYQPKPGISFLVEELAPGGSVLVTTSAHGLMSDAGLYLITWYGVSGEGGRAIRIGTNAIKAAFYPGRTVSLASGNRLRVDTDPAPSAGRVTPLESGGHSTQQVQVQYKVEWNLP